jgi:hypothetical protein
MSGSQALSRPPVAPRFIVGDRSGARIDASWSLRPGAVDLLQAGFLSTKTSETSETTETLETSETNVIPPHGRHNRRSSRLVGARRDPIYRVRLRPGVVCLLQLGFLSTETSETMETMETSVIPPYDRYNNRASWLVGASACLRPGVVGLACALGCGPCLRPGVVGVAHATI